MDINTYLRGYKQTHAVDKIAIERIDKAIGEFKLEQPIRVYRAVDLMRERAGMLPKKGDTLKWDGFTSTSTDLNAVNADGFTMYVIDVPKGQGRGAYINSLSEYKDVEYEFLLRRGTNAEVIEVIEENGKNVVKLKVV